VAEPESRAVIHWLAAFSITQLVEVPIYVRALLGDDGRDAGRVRGWPAALALAFAASTITHPIVWFVMPRLIPDHYLLMVAVAESFAIVTEAVWLRAFGLRRALAWAVFANAASVVIGLSLRRVFGWP
jgi:hypothetical protein